MINNTTVVNSLYGRSISGTTTAPFVDVFMDRDPTTNDTNYSVQQKWLNTTEGHYWELQNFNSMNGVVTANWVKIGSSQHVETLTGNTGGAVGPTSNNINVVGDGTFIRTVGTPGTSTLTIEPSGAIATSYVENIGTAVPAGGILNVLGADGVATTGSGNTITIGSNGTIATSYVENTGTAVPSLGVLNVLGGTGIITSGAGNTISITANADVATSYIANTGTAIPFANTLNVVGTSGITTTGSGNTLTVSGSGIINSINQQVFTTSGTYTPTVGMLYCQVQCVGGGGGGGGAQLNTGIANQGGGGSGGEQGFGIFNAATVGALQTITIGVGGTGGVGVAGTGGGTTSFGTLLTAVGGQAGYSGSTTAAGFPTAIPGVMGGTGGTGGSYHLQGNSSIYGAGGTANPVCGGYGANGLSGGGGLGGILLNASAMFGENGGNATSYGAGGGGAVVNLAGVIPTIATGGNGFPGVIIITEYIG